MKFTKRTYTKAYYHAFHQAKLVLFSPDYESGGKYLVRKYALLATRIRKRAAREGYGYYL